MDKPGINLSPHGYYVFSLVDKSGIHEIWTRVFCASLGKFSGSGLNSFRMDKLEVDEHMDTDTQTYAGNDNSQRQNLASSKN